MAHSTPAEQRRTSSPARGERREVITSRENKWLKVFRAALQGKGPQSDEPLGVEGLKMVEDALRSGLLVEALLVSESGGRDAEQVLRAVRQCETGIAIDRILRTSDKLFESVTGTETPQGVAALFRKREWTLEDVLRGPAPVREAVPLVAVLAGVQDPGNVGTAV